VLLVAGVAALLTMSQTPSAVGAGPCEGQPNCRQAGAAQLFELAAQLEAQGDLEGAAQILRALTDDPRPELRAEARFRLAAVLEKQGDLEGAIRTLRALLAEQPDANAVRLELSRLLAAQGNLSEARRELRRAQKIGLPPEVARAIGRFTNLLDANKMRGGSIEITAGPDSNINRSTGSRFIDTVIAPFELDPNARRQSGFGLSASAEGYSRDRVGKTTVLTRAGVHADLFPGKGPFNDIQAYASIGPEFPSRGGSIRPALTAERRWFGGDPYSRGLGGALSWVGPTSDKSQLELGLSVVRQAVDSNRLLDGTRFAAFATYDRQLTRNTIARFNLRAFVLDARAKPESLRQLTAEAIISRDFGLGSLYGSLSYAETDGRAPIPLFGKTRDENRLELSAGVVSRKTIGGFAPLLRLTHARSWSNIDLYDYRRTRIDLGVSREF